MDRQQLLQQYRMNMENAMIYGPNDIRGVMAMENVRQLLHNFPPYDPDIRAIDQEIIVGQIQTYTHPHIHSHE